MRVTVEQLWAAVVRATDEVGVGEGFLRLVARNLAVEMDSEISLTEKKNPGEFIAKVTHVDERAGVDCSGGATKCLSALLVQACVDQRDGVSPLMTQGVRILGNHSIEVVLIPDGTDGHRMP